MASDSICYGNFRWPQVVGWFLAGAELVVNLGEGGQPTYGYSCPAQVNFLMLSPPCTAFSALNYLFNYPKQPQVVVEQKIAEGMVFIQHAVCCALLQHREGRWFAFEHPVAARSWRTEPLADLCRMQGVFTANFDQCMYGLVSPEGELLRKRTKIATNSTVLIEMLRAPGNQCDGLHTHQQIQGSQWGVSVSAHAQTYPPRLVARLAEAAAQEMRRAERSR